MYIAPDTVVRFLKGVPLDASLENTIYWFSPTNQTDYFISKTKLIKTKLSYQREDVDVIRVDIPEGQLFDCNYLMFQNSAFNNKWFYAFILGTNYLGNNTTEVFYQIDPLQTWFFEHDVKESFVEREHSVTDYPGSNLVEEHLDLGEYVTDDFSTVMDLNKLAIVVLAPFNKSYQNNGGVLINNIFNGLYPNVFPLLTNQDEQIAQVKDFILGAGTKANEIACVFTMPNAFVPQDWDGAWYGTLPKDFTIEKSNTDIGGYVPINKKLLTAPYTFLYATNQQGSYGVYPYEFFAEDKCRFEFYSDCVPSPTVLCTPMKYKGANWNHEEGITLTGYPILSFATDSYSAYIAQQATNIPVSTLTTFTRNLTAPAIKSPPMVKAPGAHLAGAAKHAGVKAPGFGAKDRALNALSAAGSELVTSSVSVGSQWGINKILEAVAPQYAAPLNNGGCQSGSVMASIGRLNIVFTCKHIRREYAEIIDGYFDRYGYACHRMKIPNRSSRPHWNYVKTSGCILGGNLPASDKEILSQLYDRGITFWRHADEVGDYSFDNSPI